MNRYQRKINKESQDFIMLPTVDFCFKELMRNSKVRKGLIAALLEIEPEEIKETTLLPTILPKRYEEDKYGILDVRVKLVNGTQMDFEMQVEKLDFWENRSIFYLSKMYMDQIESGQNYDVIQKCMHISILDFVHFPQDTKWYHKIALCDMEDGKVYTDLMELHIFELKKLPTEGGKDSKIMEWMRFLSGKKKEDFKKMAARNPYIGEAYSELLKLSADKRKRLEYEARQKAIRDHNAMIHYAERTGQERGEKIGQERGEKIGQERGEKLKLMELIKKKLGKGKTITQIADELEETEENIQKIIEKYELG